MIIILKTIFYFVVWVIVPSMLVTVAWLIKSISDKAEEKRHRAAMHAGFWAGVTLSITMLIYEVSIFLRTGFPRNEIFQGISLPLVTGTALVVFMIFLGGRRVVPPFVSGLVVLISSFMVFYALIHYLFIRTHNDVLLSMILGGMFGFLTHFAASPSSLKEFLRGKSF